MKVWKVHFYGDYDFQNRLFSSAEKAYKFITKSITNADLKRFKFDLREELDYSYEFNKESFGVPSYVLVETVPVDVDVEKEDS